MSVKDIRNYQLELAAQAKEMEENLAELTELANNNIVSPDRIEEVKQLCDTIKTNRDRVTYLLYLLHKPNKKKKQAAYDRQHRHMVKENSTLEAVKAENSKCLRRMKEVIK